MATSPAVTVLLPAYNAAPWLGSALDSLLKQSFGDFEVLVMDDGSVDETPQILRRYGNPKMRVVREERNQGLVPTLNRGIELAKGRYVARMDADDTAHRRRLELQVAFLERNPDVGVCGTWFRTTHGSKRVSVCPPTRHDDITAHLFFRSPFGHPTVMMRREFLDKSGLRYDATARHAEDFDLWVRSRPWTRFANLPRFLLEYRSHAHQVSSGQADAQKTSADRIRLRQLASLLPDAAAEERALHLRVCDDHYAFRSIGELHGAGVWLRKLARKNDAIRMFSLTSFGDALEAIWYGCCLRATVPQRERLTAYLGARYTDRAGQRLRRGARLTVRALRRALSG